MGENGTLDWQGNGSSSVEAITPPYRSLLNPNRLLVGNAPGDLVEFASTDFPGGIHPLRIQDGENIANSALQRGGVSQRLMFLAQVACRHVSMPRTFASCWKN